MMNKRHRTTFMNAMSAPSVISMMYIFMSDTHLYMRHRATVSNVMFTTHVYIYIYRYVHTCVCTYVCVYTCKNIYLRNMVYIYLHMTYGHFVMFIFFMYVYVCICMYTIYMYVYMYHAYIHKMCIAYIHA